MLKIQEHLRKIPTKELALGLLEVNFGIKSKLNEDGRVILDYDQIESPRFNPMVDECRGLVLNYNDNWNLVAKAYTRFYNHGEGDKGQNEFDFDAFSATDKEDGSLILLYWYNGDWRVNTRFSFAEGIINNNSEGLAWSELFWMIVPFVEIKDKLVKGYTYVFEMCSIFNKVVRHYPVPEVFLTAIFDNEGEEVESIQNIARLLKLKTPEKYHFNNLDQAIEHIKKIEAEDKTFEGLVLRDYDGRRVKVKSSSYLILHKKLGNRNPNAEDILDMCLTDDGGAEYLSYFPELKEKFDITKHMIWEIEFVTATLMKSWTSSLKTRKDFALKAKEHEYNYILFALYGGMTYKEILTKYKSRIAETIEKVY